MAIFHLTLIVIFGKPDVVVRSDKQTRALAFKPFVYRIYLTRNYIETVEQVVKSEDEQRIAVVKDPFVDRLKVSSLIDTLKYGDRMVRYFAHRLLKAQGRDVEKLERARDTLKEHV